MWLPMREDKGTSLKAQKIDLQPHFRNERTRDTRSLHQRGLPGMADTALQMPPSLANASLSCSLTHLGAVLEAVILSPGLAAVLLAHLSRGRKTVSSNEESTRVIHVTK